MGLRELSGDSVVGRKPGERYTSWFVIQSSSREGCRSRRAGPSLFCHRPNSGDRLVVTIDQDIMFKRLRRGITACAVGPVIKRVVPELADSEGAMNRFVEKCLHRPSDIWVPAFHPQVRI